MYTMENKTPVDWLVDKIKLKYSDIDFYHIKKEIEQAQGMFKEQIMEAYDKNKMGRVNYGEQYYNETYNQ